MRDGREVGGELGGLTAGLGVVAGSRGLGRDVALRRQQMRVRIRGKFLLSSGIWPLEVSFSDSTYFYQYIKIYKFHVNDKEVYSRKINVLYARQRLRTREHLSDSKCELEHLWASDFSINASNKDMVE